jgi:predicted GTPase
MLTDEKEKIKKEIEPTVRRLNFLTRLLNADPAILTALAEKLLGKGSAMEISKEIKEADLTPQIVLIGKTGVGKSSTINKLFNPQPNLPVDHVEPATMNIEVITLSLGERGKLIIVDSPGLGVSEDADRRNMAAYREILAESDVAVWIIKGDDRTLGIDQSFITQVLPEKLRSRLVVGINQIDKIEPAKWSEEFNLPSREQEASIQRKEEIVLKSFKSEGVEPVAVVSYSALRNYHLTKLFRTIVDACPPERIAALIKRGDVKSFLSPELQDEYEQ